MLSLNPRDVGLFPALPTHVNVFCKNLPSPRNPKTDYFLVDLEIHSITKRRLIKENHKLKI